MMAESARDNPRRASGRDRIATAPGRQPPRLTCSSLSSATVVYGCLTAHCRVWTPAARGNRRSDAAGNERPHCPASASSRMTGRLGGEPSASVHPRRSRRRLSRRLLPVPSALPRHPVSHLARELPAPPPAHQRQGEVDPGRDSRGGGNATVENHPHVLLHLHARG